MANFTSKGLLKALIGLSVFPLAFNCQSALAVSFRFEQDYAPLKPYLTGGGYLVGSFTGEDTNNDGTLQCSLSSLADCELSAFQATFAGSVIDELNPQQPPLDFSTVWKFLRLEDFDFNFDLGTNTLNVAATTFDRAGGGTSGLFIDPSFGGGIDLSDYGDFAALGDPSIVPVPEPSTFLGTLAGAGLFLRRKLKNRR